MNPKVSVVMPSFNRKEYLEETIQSVLDQTFENFEFIIVDDGSTDGSLEIIKKYQKRDPRVILIENTENPGLVEAINLGIKKSKGEYIARIDSDDVCLPNRLAVEVDFLDSNPKISACGSWVRLIGNEEKILEFATKPEEIKANLFFYGGAIANPTSIVRRSVFFDLGIWYDKYFIVAEDWNFWVRAAEKVKLANIPQVLLLYRLHDENRTHQFIKEHAERHEKIWRRQLKNLGIDPTEDELKTHNQMALGRSAGRGSEVKKIRDWTEKLLTANKREKAYDRKIFNKIIEQKKSELITPYLNNRYRIIIKYWLNKILGNGGQILRIFLPGKKVDEYRRKMFKFYQTLLNIYIELEQYFSKNNAKLDHWYILLGLGVKLKRRLDGRPKIGLAILAHERPEYLEICLNTLFRTKLYDYDITFLIQDDGSKDPKVKEIINKERNSSYKIIRYFTKKGHNSWAGAFNKAIRKLNEIDNFDIVGTCDSDCIFHPEWLDWSMKIFLWAKNHHKYNKLIKFSPFNSVDYKFHKVLGIYKSPFGKYVVKERMGDLTSFYFKEDLEKIGFYEESKDDESIMTEKFKQMRIRNFCSETSYVEHLGEDSVLNQWRPVAVKRATFGLNLARGDWGVNMEKLRPYGFYRFLKKDNSFGDDLEQKSKLKVDVLIPAVKKDLEVLPLTVRSARKFLKHPIGDIFIVGPSSPELINFCKKYRCQFKDEDTVLPLKVTDVRKIGYRVDGWDRSGWIFQQLLKLSSDSISKEEYIYVIDADTVLVSPQKFEKDGKSLLLAADEFHYPYFETYKKLLGYETTSNFSFVAHQMLFNTKGLKELRAEIEKKNNKSWYQAILDSLDLTEISSFSEYETYGNWMTKKHLDEISFEYWYNKTIAKARYKKFHFKKNPFRNKFRSVSFHDYTKGIIGLLKH